MTSVYGDFDGAVSGITAGAISAARAAGLPDYLAVPLLPWNAPLGDRFNEKDRGKLPADPDPAFPPLATAWKGIAGWQKGGYPIEHSLRWEQLGCNAGIVLGIPAEGLHAAAIDCDPAEGHEAEWPLIVESLAYSLGRAADAWVRRTRPGSSAMLVNVRDLVPGSKTVLHVQKDGTDIGKIELLTHGQQLVL